MIHTFMGEPDKMAFVQLNLLPAPANAFGDIDR